MPTFAVDDLLRHSGEIGLFIVKKVRDNGDLDVFGGQGWEPGAIGGKYHAQFRTFRPNECRTAKRKKVLRKADDA